MATSLKVLKAKTLRKQLNALPDIAKRHVEGGLLAAGREVEAVMRDLVPKDERVLEASIRTVFTSEDQNTVAVGPSGAFLKAHGRATNLPRWVEFGTKKQRKGELVSSLGKRGKVRSRRAAANHGGTPAQPFVYPAWMAKKKAARKRVADSVNRALKETAKIKGGGDG